MRRTILLLLMLCSAVAFAQASSPSGGGISASCSSCNLSDATLTLSGAFTSNVANGSTAILLANEGAKICLKADCTERIQGDGFGQMQFFSGNHYRFVSGNVSADALVIAGNVLANTLSLAGSASTNPVTITATGSNNASIQLVPAGTGAVIPASDAAVSLGTASLRWNANLFQVTNNNYLDSGGFARVTTTPSGTTTYKDNSTDGSSAVGHTFDTANAFSTTGAKLVSWKNHAVEKAFIDLNGTPRFNHIQCTMSAATTCTATVPTGSVCQCQATAGTAIAQSCNVSTVTATCTANGSNSNTWNIYVQ